MKKDPRRARRARNTLILAACLFAVSQAVLGVLLDHVWPLLRFPAASHVFERLAAAPANPDVLFLGSSRGQICIAEQECSALLAHECRLSRHVRVFNASVPAGDHFAQYHLLGELLRAGVRPRLVVLELSPEFLGPRNPFYSYSHLRHLGWGDLPEHARALFGASCFGKLAGARLLPAYQHRHHLAAVSANLLLTGSPGAYLATPRLSFRPPAPRTAGPRPVPWEKLLDVPVPPHTPETSAAIRVDADRVRRKWLRDYAPTGAALRALFGCERRCREAGIEVLFYTPPVTSAHRATWTPEIEAVYQSTIAELVARSQSRHVDCRDWLSDDHFGDHHHALAEGGTLFSRKFTQRVLAPWWKGKERDRS